MNAPSLTAPPTHALLRLPPSWLTFEQPSQWLSTSTHHEVRDVLEVVETSVRDGAFAVGFLSYEAAPAFDPALEVAAPAPDLPLVGFALFGSARALLSPPLRGLDRLAWPPRSDMTPRDYRQAFQEIHRRIEAGDVYQVNHTFPFRLTAREHDQVRPHCDRLQGLSLLQALCAAQGGDYGGWLQHGALEIASASPELFFELREGRIVTKPMKGTAPRGRFEAEDQAIARDLRESAKDRAENVMIVDMMRNDLGRIAEPGSVEVTRLFEVEQLPTLHQMTSTVAARTRAGLGELLAALFPCASITGAPKITAMRTIRELESAPRGVYTGSLGMVLPDTPERLGLLEHRRATAPGTPCGGAASGGLYARFNVAIRTAWRSAPDAPFHYGVGSGVVWDSLADREFAECHSKAQALAPAEQEFGLIETMKVRRRTAKQADPLERIWLLPEHLTRLRESAAYFAIDLDEAEILTQLRGMLDGLPGWEERKLRTVLGRGGSLDCTLGPLPPRSRSVRLAVAADPIDESDPFLCHKTTARAPYERALQAARADDHGIDDVVLWNRAGQVTETTIANLLVPPLPGSTAWRTPPRTTGLLAGTLRARLLRRGWIEECPLDLDDLRAAPTVLLINAVRGFARGVLTPHHRASPGP